MDYNYSMSNKDMVATSGQSIAFLHMHSIYVCEKWQELGEDVILWCSRDGAHTNTHFAHNHSGYRAQCDVQ